MKVSELREMLKEYPEDAEVYVEDGEGNYYPFSNIQTGEIKEFFSGYYGRIYKNVYLPTANINAKHVKVLGQAIILS